MKNRKRLLKTVGLLTAATVMTVSFNTESVLAQPHKKVPAPVHNISGRIPLSFHIPLSYPHC